MAVGVYLKRKKRVFSFKFLRMPEQSLCKQDKGRCIILLDEEDFKKNYLYGKIWPYITGILGDGQNFA